MDVVKIVGFTSYSFAGNDGKQVEGYKYHCTAAAPERDTNFQGVQVLTLGVSTVKRNQWLAAGLFVPQVGDECLVYYNRYGKVDQFGPVPVQGRMPLTDAEKAVHDGGKK